MSLFTIILGSAYRDNTEYNCLVEAANPQAACEYALRIASGFRDDCRTVLYCFEGEVKFCPTIFGAENNAMNEYVPVVVDLRPPAEVKMTRWGIAKVPVAIGRKMVKRLGDRGLLSKVQVIVGTSDYTINLLMPARMDDDKASEIIRNIFGDVCFPNPISTAQLAEMNALEVTFVELPTEIEGK